MPEAKKKKTVTITTATGEIKEFGANKSKQTPAGAAKHKAGATAKAPPATKGTDAKKDGEGTSAGAIVGIVLGSVAAVGLLVVAVAAARRPKVATPPAQVHHFPAAV